jgi:hypothetical protein
VINILYGGAVAGMLALVPLYAGDRYRISVLGSGTLLTAEGIAVIVALSLAAMGLRRTGYRWPLYIGSACTAIGVAALAINPAGVSPYAWLAMSACVIGLGTGLSSLASRNAGLQLARTSPRPSRRCGQRAGWSGRSPRSRSPPRSSPSRRRPVSSRPGSSSSSPPAPRLPAGHRPRPRTPRILVRNPRTRHG